MYPRLIAIAGPLQATIFEVIEEEVSIGREGSNRLAIDDISVSRRHCVIKKEAGRYKITDLGSHNGTFVNDVPANERFLEHGDLIRTGNSLLLFLLHEVETLPDPRKFQFDDGTFITKSAIRVRTEDALYLMARDLHALMEISMTINSIRDLEGLQRKLLELILTVVPAEHAAIILAEEGLEEPTSAFTYDKRSGPDGPVRVSRTVARQVLREGAAVLSNDVSESEAFGSAESLITSRIQSQLCVPLVLFGKTLGIIYLDTSDPAVRFDKDHLQLLTAIAGIAAVALENARHLKQLESENQLLRADSAIEHNMVGESPRMRRVYQFIARVAPTDSTVLVGGESGTGKELAARAIHQNSPRAGRPFVAINCAALTDTLLESELFGHEKGAFTGAIAQKKGKLEVADGGTVFLDEVGEMALSLQAKLLRVLQEREFERVGGTHAIKVDIRLIAATNKDLEEAIKGGSFRQDLYYRLNVVSLEMPSLRERREDIPLLASYFVAKYSKKCKRRVTGISREARQCLVSYDWPGNVRELENTIERAVVLGSTELILPDDLPEDVLEAEASTNVPLTKYYEAVNEAKKQIILRAVEQTNGNYTEAAKLLGVHPNNLHRLIRNMNLKAMIKK